MSRADIYREAMSLIQQCGEERDAKAYAFSQSSLCYEQGDVADATRWAEIANAIDQVLEGVTTAEHLPKALH